MAESEDLRPAVQGDGEDVLTLPPMLEGGLVARKERAARFAKSRAHDQTVADDYFAAMQRIEQRLEIVSSEPENTEVVKAQEPAKLFQLAEQLTQPELCFEERLEIVAQLRQLFGVVQEHPPPEFELAAI